MTRHPAPAPHPNVTAKRGRVGSAADGSGALRVRKPTRTEFLSCATGPAHRDELAEELNTLAETAPVPETAWRWVDIAQDKLTQKGQHHAAGPLDLLVCATTAHHGPTVLHVDNDYPTATTVLPELQQRDIRG